MSETLQMFPVLAPGETREEEGRASRKTKAQPLLATETKWNPEHPMRDAKTHRCC